MKKWSRGQIRRILLPAALVPAPLVEIVADSAPGVDRAR